MVREGRNRREQKLWKEKGAGDDDERSMSGLHTAAVGTWGRCLPCTVFFVVVVFSPPLVFFFFSLVLLRFTFLLCVRVSVISVSPCPIPLQSSVGPRSYRLLYHVPRRIFTQRRAPFPTQKNIVILPGGGLVYFATFVCLLRRHVFHKRVSLFCLKPSAATLSRRPCVSTTTSSRSRGPVYSSKTEQR